MDSASPPPAPDPVATANAQGQMNKETAIAQAQLNMVDQYGPFGSSVYTQIPGTGGVAPSAPLSAADYYGGPNAGRAIPRAGGNAYSAASSYTNGTPRYAQTVTLSPTQQALYNAQTGIQLDALNLGKGAVGAVQNAISKPFSLNGLPPQVNNVNGGNIVSSIGATAPVQTTFGASGNIQSALPNADNYSADRQRVEDALYARLNPQLEQDRSSLETRLANQGITPGTPAYDRAMGLYGQQVNDARNQVVLAGGQEQSRLAGLDLSAGQFANSAQEQGYEQALGRGTFANAGAEQQLQDALARAGFSNAAQAQKFGQGVTNANLQNAGRQQGIQEAAYLRSQPINELAALMGFSPGVSVPQFQNNPQTAIAPPDYQGAVNTAYQAKLNNYNQQLAANNSMLGSIFGLGGQLGAAAIMSDRRTKTDIRPIGVHDSGLTVYAFRYKSGGPERIGFMADEVEKVRPWAVIDTPSGLKMVNYELAAA